MSTSSETATEADPPVFVLAGGFGTRLREVVSDVPKPLAPIAGRPFLGYLLDEWLRDGAKTFVFTLHYKAAQIEAFVNEYFCKLNDCSLSFSCFTEPEPLGTGGAVRFALSQLRSPPSEILIANADTWLPGGIHRLRCVEADCLVSARVDNCSRYGRLHLNGDKVLGFYEKSDLDISGLINAGAYRLNSKYFLSDSFGDVFSLERQILKQIVKEGNLKTSFCNGQFIDIGIAEDFTRFDRWVSKGMTGDI